MIKNIVKSSTGAGEDQPPIATECRLNLVQPFEMSQRILRHGPHPAIDFHKPWLCSDAAYTGQFCSDPRHQGLVIQLKNGFSPDSADITTDQQLIRRSAVRPLERCPGRRNEVASFCARDNKTEALSCAGHRRTRIGHRDRRRRGIGNHLQQTTGNGREWTNQLRRHIGRGCQHETVHGQGRAVIENDIIHPTTELMGSHTQGVNGTLL